MKEGQPKETKPGASAAYLLGQGVQALVLAVVIVAIIARLLKVSDLAFRYGGF